VTAHAQPPQWSGSIYLRNSAGGVGGVACESLNISGTVVQRIRITTAITVLPFAKIPAQKSLLRDMKFRGAQ
jgi:hypothetical protein